MFCLLHLYSPFITNYSHYSTKQGTSAGIKAHMWLRFRGTTILLCNIKNKQETDWAQMTNWIIMFDKSVSGVVMKVVRNSLLQVRSGSLHFPSIQVIIPEPLSISYPLAHSKVTSESSGKSFIRSASLVNTVFPRPWGLGQSAEEKRGKEAKHQHLTV